MSDYSSFAPETLLFRIQSVTYYYVFPHTVRNNNVSGSKPKHAEQLQK